LRLLIFIVGAGEGLSMWVIGKERGMEMRGCGCWVSVDSSLGFVISGPCLGVSGSYFFGCGKVSCDSVVGSG
jgi:hypothetical protein